MFHLLFAAKSGWGKSFNAQAWMERNMKGDTFDAVLVLDYKDEFRGLVKAGYARHWGAGPHERDSWGAAEYGALIEQNGNVVLARHDALSSDDWQQVVADAITGARRSDLDVLICIDEAHTVAPKGETIPDPITELATTGRGEGASSMWITQRLQKLDETIISQTTARMLGGFGSDRDRGKLPIEYPAIIHNPSAEPGDLPAAMNSALAAPEGMVPLRKFKNDQNQTIGSEWIYSDDEGTVRRMDSRKITMESTHYGSAGNEIEVPDYG